MVSKQDIQPIFIGIILIALLGFVGNLVINMTQEGVQHDYSLTLSDENEIADNLDVGDYSAVVSGTVTSDLSGANTGTNENVLVQLNGNTVFDNDNVQSTPTIENNVKSFITKNNNELTITIDNTGAVTDYAFTLETTIERDQLTVVEKLAEHGPKIVLILIIGLFVSGVALLLDRLGVIQ